MNSFSFFFFYLHIAQPALSESCSSHLLRVLELSPACVCLKTLMASSVHNNGGVSKVSRVVTCMCGLLINFPSFLPRDWQVIARWLPGLAMLIRCMSGRVWDITGCTARCLLYLVSGSGTLKQNFPSWRSGDGVQEENGLKSSALQLQCPPYNFNLNSAPTRDIYLPLTLNTNMCVY